MRLLAFFARGVAYFAVATIIAQAIGVYLLWSNGRLNHESMMQIVAVLQGFGLEAFAPDEVDQRRRHEEEQPSLEQIARARARETRELEIREQALRQGLERWNYEFDRLAEERAQFERIKNGFERQLAEMREAAEVGGEQTVRATIEKSKPRDAKRILQEMIAQGEIAVVVSLLADMSVTNRTKIAAEFETEEEIKQLDEIYRMMRQGAPEGPLAEEAQAALGKPPQLEPLETQ